MKKKWNRWLFPFGRGTSKLEKVMRLLFVLIVAVYFQATAETFSQSKKVDLKLKNASLNEALKSVQQATGVDIYFQSEMLPAEKNITVDESNVSVNEILNVLLENTGLTYKMINNNVVIVPVKSELSVTQVGQGQHKVTGLVTDSQGEPLPGVNVFEKENVTNGVITGIDGNYTIEVSSPEAVLSFSFIGFEGQEVQIAGRSNIDVTLMEETTGLDEVVVVGYGTQKKANLTGSVATVNAEQLTSRPVQSVSGALSGTMSGVTAIQTSGEPGSQNASITIRGKNSINGGSPLVIVDGVPGSMNSIDMNDVENISVLKDAASAAIYGVSAANGVILITTKKGQKDQGATISYNSYYSWTQPTYTPSYLGSYDFAVLYNEGYKNDNPESTTIPYSAEDLQKFKDGSSPYTHPNTDWFGEVLNKWAFEQNHHLQLSGGTKNTTYNASFGFLDQGALIDNIDYNRYNVRANIQSDISDKLSVGMNLYGHQEYKNSGWAGSGSIYSWLTRTPPTVPLNNPDGSYSYHEYQNAAAHIGNDGYNNNNWTEGKVILNATYKPVKNVSVKGVYSARYNYSHNEKFKKDLTYSNMEGTMTYSSGDREMHENTSRQQRITYQLMADYRAKLAEDHNFYVLGGFEQYDYKNNWTDAWRKGFTNDDLHELDNGDAENQFNRGNGEDYGRRSYFGRFNYDYKGKYLLEGNMRYDGTSWFDSDVRWGLFTALSAGWRLSEEEFMQGLDWLDNLKLRAGWGSTGNNELGSYRKNEHWFGEYYEHVATYGVGGSYILGDKMVQGAWEGKFPNAELTWATVTSYEGAVEATFLRGLIGFELAYYKKVTTDMILGLPVPSVLGQGAPNQNAGELKNTGFDLMLTHKKQLGEFSYDVNLNFSYNKNEITDLKEADYQDGKYWVGSGYAFGSFYGYENEGLFRDQADIDNHATQSGNIAPGDIKYKDQNGDGEITGDDRVVIGKNFPSYTMGLNVNAHYRNWDLSLFFQGALDVDVYFENEAAYAFFNGGKVMDRHLDRWTPDNLDASYPRITMSQQHNYSTSDFWLEDGSYVRLKNINIGYNLPASLMSKVGVGSAKIYFSGENLLTFSGLDDFDPEAPAVNRGWYYGNVKKLSLGLKVNF